MTQQMRNVMIEMLEAKAGNELAAAKEKAAVVIFERLDAKYVGSVNSLVRKYKRAELDADALKLGSLIEGNKMTVVGYIFDVLAAAKDKDGYLSQVFIDSVSAGMTEKTPSQVQIDNIKEEEKVIMEEMAEQQRLFGVVPNEMPQGEIFGKHRSYVKAIGHNCSINLDAVDDSFQPARVVLFELTCVEKGDFSKDPRYQKVDSNRYQKLYWLDRNDVRLVTDEDGKRKGVFGKRAKGRIYFHAYKFDLEDGWSKEKVFLPKGFGSMTYEQQQEAYDITIARCKKWVDCGSWR